jgi:hypothetical protein
MMTIHEFAQKVGITLNPGQVLIFDEWYHPLRMSSVFGPEDDFQKPSETFTFPKFGFFALGRRGGATTAAAIILAYEAFHAAYKAFNDPHALNKGSFVYITHDKAMCRETTPIVAQIIRNVTKDTSIQYEIGRDQITLWRQPNCQEWNPIEPPKTRIFFRHATANATTTRGMSVQLAILDDFALFPDPEDAFYSILPTVALGNARLMVMSNPHKDPQNFFNQQWHKGCLANTIVFAIPTWVMNPSLGSEDALRQEMSRWNVDFDREYGAQVPKLT